VWQRVRGVAVPSDQEPRQLDAVLQQFYAELRKEDGSEYEPDSLRVMLASLDRHFQEKGLPFSIRKDKAFEASRRTLNGKAIELREAGLGKRKNKADALTEEDEEKLWRCMVGHDVNATGPLCGLWSQLLDQGLGKESDLVQAPVVLDMIQRTLRSTGKCKQSPQ